MRRWLRYTLIPLLFVLLAAAPVSAGIIYCKNDPIVQLNDTPVEFSIAIPLEDVTKVNGPVLYEVQTPKDVKRAIIVDDDIGFGAGADLFFTDGGAMDGEIFPVKIRIRIPMKLEPDEVVPTQMTVLLTDGTVLVVTGTSEMTQVHFDLKGS